MSASAIIAQLSALSDSLKTTNTLITRLAKLHLQPGSEPLDGSTSVRTELAQEIHENLKELEEEFEFLEQEAEQEAEYYKATNRRSKDGTEPSAQLAAKVVRLREDLTHSRQSFRNAQISAKFASEQAKRQEREALYAEYRKEAEEIEQTEGDTRELLFAGRSGKTASQRQRGLNKDEVLVHASTDVTNALKRTHALLSTELARSRFAQETFDETTRALAQLGEDYGNLDNLLSKSRSLLGTLLKSQKSDTWYLETAFYILLTTLCWLIFRRLLFGPFVKLPLFLWRLGLFFANWVLWKPLFALLSVTGVISSAPATTTALASSSTRAPLIVQPSATGRAKTFPSDMPESPGMPAGAGGANAKKGKDGAALDGKLSEQIGKMAEDSAKSGEESADPEERELPRRGDGTVLQERGDVPKNPKKKNFEADVEDAKHEQRVKRDEL